jgi:hypothetical protein
MTSRRTIKLSHAGKKTMNDQNATAQPASTPGVGSSAVLGHLSNRQRTALENHCRLAGECLHPRFIELRGDVSLIVTVNSGYECGRLARGVPKNYSAAEIERRSKILAGINARKRKKAKRAGRPNAPDQRPGAPRLTLALSRETAAPRKFARLATGGWPSTHR